jgi:hypothetical protein
MNYFIIPVKINTVFLSILALAALYNFQSLALCFESIYSFKTSQLFIITIFILKNIGLKEMIRQVDEDHENKINFKGVSFL